MAVNYEEIKEIADYIIKELKKDDFIIQRYDSITTNSIYLKLDYGVSNSIRISDHKGKKHLKYKFNVNAHMDNATHKKDTLMTRNYYGRKDLETLIKHIKMLKHSKEMYLGRAGYEYEMRICKKSGQFKKGFWQASWEV